MLEKFRLVSEGSERRSGWCQRGVLDYREVQVGVRGSVIPTIELQLGVRGEC